MKDRLSQRETEIVQLLAKGMCNKEIATALGLTEGTVKGYLSTIFQKLHLDSRLKVALWASGREELFYGSLHY